MIVRDVYIHSAGKMRSLQVVHMITTGVHSVVKYSVFNSSWSNYNFNCNQQDATIFGLFDVLLTVHLSKFILVINQLDAQNLFHNKFIICLYMFRALCAHHQEVKIVLYSLWYHHTETDEWSKITKIIKIIKIYKY